MDTDSFVLGVNTKDKIKDLKNPVDLFDLSTLSENGDLFSSEKIYIQNFEIETPRNTWIDDYTCLRSKMYAFKCEDDSKNKLKSSFKS